MRTRTRLAHSLIAALIAGGGLTAAVLAATGTDNGPLGLTCAEYSDLSQLEQVDLATQWAMTRGAVSTPDAPGADLAFELQARCDDGPEQMLSDVGTG